MNYLPTICGGESGRDTITIPKEMVVLYWPCVGGRTLCGRDG